MGVLCKTAAGALVWMCAVWAQDAPGDTARGLEYYGSILNERPGLPEAHYGAGWEAYRAGDYPQAKRQFESSLQTDDPELRARALYNLGNTRFQQGRYAESLNHYRRALRLNPGDRDAKANYELTLKRIRKPPERDQSRSGDSDRQDDSQKKEDAEQEQEPQTKGQEKPAQADAVLNALQANDRNLMKRRWKTAQPAPVEKDW